MQNMLLIH